MVRSCLKLVAGTAETADRTVEIIMSPRDRQMTLPSTSWYDEAKDGQYVLILAAAQSMIDTEDDFVLLTAGKDATACTDE